MSYELQSFCFFQNLRLDPFCPFAGGLLSDCEIRWHCVIKPAIYQSPLLIMRKHRFTTLSIEDFLCNNEEQKLLDTIFSLRRTVIICGPCGSGKTSLCYVLLKKYAASERVCFLEDYSEIPTNNPLWIKLLKRKKSIDNRAGLEFENLLSEALRLSPQRIILGEIKTNELSVFLNASLSGHGGSITTFHSDCVNDFVNRVKICDTQEEKLLNSVLKSVYLIFVKRFEGSPAIKNIVSLHNFL
jgi:pilus assembly protein CpaF